jgi:methylated-DNA-[protein]-cysteine S-methyltransferase
MKRDLIKTEEDVVRFLRDKSQFEREVLLATFRIPKGRVSTYKRIAEKIGKPRSYRAVGNALHKNPLAPIVPCHRVVKFDGTFGGDEKGAASRRRHLEKEGILVVEGRVAMSDDILF